MGWIIIDRIKDVLYIEHFHAIFCNQPVRNAVGWVSMLKIDMPHSKRGRQLGLALYGLTRNAGGFLNRESMLRFGSGPLKSMLSSRGLRYSSSDVIGLLISIGTPRFPLSSCVVSVNTTGLRYVSFCSFCTIQLTLWTLFVPTDGTGRWENRGSKVSCI